MNLLENNFLYWILIWKELSKPCIERKDSKKKCRLFQVAKFHFWIYNDFYE